MRIRRNHIAVAALAVALYAGWSAVGLGGHDVAVLRSFDWNGSDLFTTLWTVEDGRFVWIRANRPDRVWLQHVRRNPDVVLDLRGRSASYRAMLLDTPDAQAYVDARFRAKYGLADRWREWTSGTQTVAVRLEPR